MQRDLPREVRNLIYHNTITKPTGIFFITHGDSNKLCRSQVVVINERSSNALLKPFECFNLHVADPRNLALLRASKTIHAEAGAILYGQNLVFDGLTALQSFLASHSSSQISLLRH